VLPLQRADVEGIIDADPHATAVSKGVHSKKLIIGEVALEPDSSLYVEVPPNVPWIVQALDKDKRALYTLQRQFYTQPGERFTLSIPRSKFLNTCGGCHGSLTADPMDSIGPADIVTEASKVMATWNPQEQTRRAPVAQGARSSDFIAIDFVRDVQPLLDRHCVGCHQGGGLDLRGKSTRHYSVAYESLHQLRDPRSGNFAAKKYINEREALSAQSPLIDKLMSPGHRYLSDDELLMLIRWVDIGATFKGAM
jgi:mono/diheme cytochrome c family protein